MYFRVNVGDTDQSPHTNTNHTTKLPIYQYITNFFRYNFAQSPHIFSTQPTRSPQNITKPTHKSSTLPTPPTFLTLTNHPNSSPYNSLQFFSTPINSHCSYNFYPPYYSYLPFPQKIGLLVKKSESGTILLSGLTHFEF